MPFAGTKLNQNRPCNTSFESEEWDILCQIKIVKRKANFMRPREPFAIFSRSNGPKYSIMQTCYLMLHSGLTHGLLMPMNHETQQCPLKCFGNCIIRQGHKAQEVNQLCMT